MSASPKPMWNWIGSPSSTAGGERRSGSAPGRPAAGRPSPRRPRRPPRRGGGAGSRSRPDPVRGDRLHARPRRPRHGRREPLRGSAGAAPPAPRPRRPAPRPPLQPDDRGSRGRRRSPRQLAPAWSARPAGTRCPRRTASCRSAARNRRATSAGAELARAGPGSRRRDACGSRSSTGAQCRRTASPTGLSKLRPAGRRRAALGEQRLHARRRRGRASLTPWQWWSTSSIRSSHIADGVPDQYDPPVRLGDRLRGQALDRWPARRGGPPPPRRPARRRAPPAAAPDFSNASARVGQRLGQPADPALGQLGRVEPAGSPVTGGPGRGPRRIPSSPAASTPAKARYGFAARSTHFTSRFAAAVPVPDRAGDHPHAPASRFSWPQAANAPAQCDGLQPQVARRARARAARPAPAAARGRRPANASASAVMPEPAVAAGVQVAPVAPGRQVQVAAVADAAGQHRRRERRPQPVPLGHRPDRLPDQHAAVGRGDRVERADRDLVLPGRVLGMELVDLDALARPARRSRSAL